MPLTDRDVGGKRLAQGHQATRRASPPQLLFPTGGSRWATVPRSHPALQLLGRLGKADRAEQTSES